MDSQNSIRQVDFNQVKDCKALDYMDSGIAVLTDIKELLLESNSMQFNMVVLVACTDGRIQLELNSVKHVIRKYDVLVCTPNLRITNWSLSPDFEGCALCLSLESVLAHYAANDIWDNVFSIRNNPIIHLDEDGLNLFQLYGSLLRTKIKMERSPYRKNILASIVCALLYELLDNVVPSAESYGKGLMKQREVLFRKFLGLLSTTRIKPRSVSWYAEQLCVTPKYFSTVIKQASGKTALVWINEYILIDVRYWLKNTGKSIKEVADILKFPNISSFGKFCRTHFGVSPTELRKQLREQSNEKG